MSALSAALIGNARDLQALEPEWWALWRRAPQATPFQSPAWLLPWWRSFAPGVLATVAIRRGDRLVALAPLYREERDRETRLVPLGLGTTDYLDLLLDPQDAEQAGSLLFATFAERVPEWREIDLEELPPDAAALHIAAPSGCEAIVVAQHPCPVLDLTRELSPGVQRRLRRGAARAERRGGWTIERVSGDQLDAFLDELFRLHASRWRQRHEPGVLGDSAVQRFHREALPRLVGAELARLYALRIGGKLAAAYYGLFDRGRGYAYITGFDLDFAPASPGNLVVAHAIAEAKRAGGSEFHFLRGGESYKYDWGAVDRWNVCRRLLRQEADACV